MLKALYSPIYFTKPAAEPMDILRKRLAQYGPVRVGSDGAEWMTLLDGSEALVADMSESDTTVGAEVAYALHKCRIPVLCLRRRGTSAVRAMETSTHPLLTCHEYADDSSAESAIDAFLTPPASPGRIFVVEGGDGAGKQTQTALLRDRLTAMGYPVSTIDFPHDAAMHGKLIRTLLSGAMGDIKSVNPLLFASLYAQNRFDVAPLLRFWIQRGDNVILDRYVEANFGHQASKLPSDERPQLIEALSKFEHDWLGVPRAHRVTYLDLPPNDAAAALSADGTRAALDMHETAGADYKNGVRDTYLWCACHFGHWQRLDCVAQDGNRISKEELNDALFDSLAADFVNRNPA